MSLPDLRDVRRARVVKAGVPVAWLSRVAGGVEFRYDDTQSGPAVATSLPLGAPPVVTAAGALPPFFTGLLPEGRRLAALQRELKASSDDELSLLMAVGVDVVGDVSVVPDGVGMPAPEPAVRWSATAAVDFSEVRDRVVDRRGLPGVQDKVSAAMITLPAKALTREAIIKLTPPEYPHLVDNEAYFLNLARTAGLRAPRHRVIVDRHGERGLLIERFDRVGDAGRIAMEDGAQVLARYPADKYAASTEEVALALIGQCSARAAAAREILRMVTFAWLTGNGDLHAKNLAILAAGPEWRIAPAYDVPSSLPYGDTTMALPIGGRRDDISRKALLALADDLGVSTPAATRALDEMVKATEPVMAMWERGEAEFTHPRRADVLRHLRWRRRLVESG